MAKDSASGTSLLVIFVKSKKSTSVSSSFVRFYVHHSLGLARNIWANAHRSRRAMRYEQPAGRTGTCLAPFEGRSFSIIRQFAHRPLTPHPQSPHTYSVFPHTRCRGGLHQWSCNKSLILSNPYYFDKAALEGFLAL